VSNIAFGVGHYEDYPYDTDYGLVGGEPFWMNQRVSTAASTAQTGIGGIILGNGGDLLESGWEALYQIGAGDGCGVRAPL